MSKTYEFVCHDCKSRLWVGQDNHIYGTDSHRDQQREFFFEHVGHRLEFNNSELIDSDYVEIEVPDDD